MNTSRDAKKRVDDARWREETKRFEDESPFDWVVIRCANGEAAATEARLQQ